MIKEAQSPEDLRNISRLALGLDIAEFTREMMETTDDRKVAVQTKEQKFDDVEFLGILTFGKKSGVEKITKKFRLYS